MTVGNTTPSLFAVGKIFDSVEKKSESNRVAFQNYYSTPNVLISFSFWFAYT